VRVALTLIEHEWDAAQQGADNRMIVDIGQSYIRTIR
jgi:hypothetical protein